MSNIVEQPIMENGELIKTLKFYYDDQGNQIKKERIMPDGSIFEIYEITGGIIEYKTFPVDIPVEPVKTQEQIIQELLARIATLEQKLNG